METKGKQSPHTRIPVKSSQLDESGVDLSPEWGFIYRQTVIKSFLTQMEIFDPGLLRHSHLVTHYTFLMAQSLGFTSADEIKLLHSSLLYDLGMMGIDRRIQEKKGKLTPQEWKVIHVHPQNAVKILSVFPFLREVIPIVRHHHEWYDGTGYPDGLIGEHIPLISRIIMIADAFVALISDRPYRPSLTTDEALEVIEKNSGIQFDPTLIPLFTILVSEDLKSSSLQMEKQNG